MRKLQCALIALLFLTANTWTHGSLPTSQTQPNSRVQHSSEYDSLMRAVDATRRKNGQPDGLPSQDAVGQSAKLLASDGAPSDYFGISVALNGNTAIVGAYFDDVGTNAEQGSAYVFVRTGGVWSEQAHLTAGGGAASDLFGISVAINNNTAVVGAQFDDVNTNTDQGSAYVFTRSGSVWTQEAQLTATGGQSNDGFGFDLAVSGDTVVVGAFGDDIGPSSDQGSAYVFTRSGTAWSQQAQLIASDGAPTDNFGKSVAIDGDTIVAGAANDNVTPNIDQGSAYVFTRSGSVWSEQAHLTAADGAAGDFFGISVGISGDSAVIGSYQDNVGSNADQGSAYVFTRIASVWSQQSKLTAADGAASDFFGFSVAISGETMIVGAFGDDIAGSSDQGSAYVFTRSGTTWSQKPRLTAADGASNDNFGLAVDISGSNMLVGAFFDDVAANLHQGSAFIYRALSANWTLESRTTLAGGAMDDRFGNSVSISGDTAVVGAPRVNVGTNSDQGTAHIFTRSGSTWTLQAQLLATAGATNDNFGYSVAISGDTAIISAPFKTFGPNSFQGAAYVFTRSGGVWTQQAQLTALDGAGFDTLGSSVAISGDTAIVGAPSAAIGVVPGVGAAYVFKRTGSSWSQQAKLTHSGGLQNDDFGYSVTISEDTVVVGADQVNVGANSNQGAAYVFTRSGTTWTQQAQLLATGGATDDGFGSSAALSGETAIVGAFRVDVNGNFQQGAAYVFTRSGSGWSQEAQLTALDGAQFESFGFSVAISGDTVAVGTPGDNFFQGSVRVFERNGTTWTPVAMLLDSSGANSDRFGDSVAIGDDKILVGAPYVDTSLTALNSRSGKHLVAPDAVDQGAAIFFINALLPPTAASFSIGGRVFTPNGAGLTNAIVHMTNQDGETQMTRTSAFGYYRFDEVAAGQTVILTVESKRYAFTPQVLFVIEEMTDLNIFADP